MVTLRVFYLSDLVRYTLNKSVMCYVSELVG